MKEPFKIRGSTCKNLGFQDMEVDACESGGKMVLIYF